MKVLLFFTIAVVLLSRQITFLTDIPAPVYIVFGGWVVFSLMFRLGRRHTIKLNRFDFAVLGLMTIPLLFLSIRELVIWPEFYVPFRQSVVATILYMMFFSGYAAMRFAPVAIGDGWFAFWGFVAVAVLNMGVVYLQEVNLIGQFATHQDLIGGKISIHLYDYDASWGIFRTRNQGLFAFWHASGIAGVLLVGAYWGLYPYANSVPKALILIFALLAAVGGIYLTGSRGSIAILVITMISLICWKTVLVVLGISTTQWGQKTARNIAVLFSIIILSIIIVTTNVLDIFLSTFTSTNPLGEFGFSRRIAGSLRSLSFILGEDVLNALLGWGMGVGGVGQSRGVSVLPANTIDIFGIGLLSDLGLVGFTAYILLFCSLFFYVQRAYRIMIPYLSGADRQFINILTKFVQFGLFVGLISIFIHGFFVFKAYHGIAFLFLGLLANFYEQLEHRLRVMPFLPENLTGKTPMAGR